MDLFYQTNTDKFPKDRRESFLQECYYHPGRIGFRFDTLDCRKSFQRQTQPDVGFDEALETVGSSGHLIVVLRRPVNRLDEVHGEIMVRTSNKKDPGMEYFLYLFLTKPAFYEVVEKWGLQQQPYLLDKSRPL